jgi:hypothetical protein
MVEQFPQLFSLFLDVALPIWVAVKGGSLEPAIFSL